MLSILLFLFPRLRTKLVWAQGLTYVKIIRTTLAGSVRMADQFPNADGPVRGMAVYSHSMAGSCRTTRLIVITRVINRKAPDGNRKPNTG